MERKTVRIQRHFFQDWHDAEGCTPSGTFIVTSAEEDDPDPTGVRFAQVDRGDIGIVGVLEIAGFNAKRGNRTVAALHIDGAQAEVLSGILKAYSHRVGTSQEDKPRSQWDDDIPPRRFGPMKSDDALVGKPCPACNKPIAVGDYVALAPVGPGDDPEARERARTGRPYNAVALAVHYPCATGKE